MKSVNTTHLSASRPERNTDAYPFDGRARRGHCVLRGGETQGRRPCLEVMSRRQVEAIRDASQGWKQAVRYKKQDSHPWQTHFIEMGRKTVIRRLAKYLPLSVE